MNRDSSTNGHRERRQTGVQGSVAMEKGRGKAGTHWAKGLWRRSSLSGLCRDGHQSMRCEKPGHLFNGSAGNPSPKYGG